MWWMLAGVAAGALLGIALYELAMSIVEDWVMENRNRKTRYAALFKEHMQNGDYNVIGGVFQKKFMSNQPGKLQAQTSWQVSELDDDLEDAFDGEDEVVWVLD